MREGLNSAGTSDAGLHAQALFPGRVGISLEEYCTATGISRTTGYLAARRGELRTIRVGRRLIVPIAELEPFLAGVNPDAA